MKEKRVNGSGVHDPTAYRALEKIELQEKVDKRPVVYICSPFAGNIKNNVNNAAKYSRFACFHGAVPFTPHLLYPQFLDNDEEHEHDLAMCFNKRMLVRCDEIWAFGNKITSGMNEELNWARKQKIRIRIFNENCKEIRVKDRR